MTRLKAFSSNQDGNTALATRVADELTAEPLASGLYLVATPIGNLADITIRALQVLAGADVVYCEDTRHTGKLLAHFAIRTPMRPYHEHNAAAERPRVLATLAAGKAVALVSDAGTPLVSDPGLKLVRAAIEEGYPVTSIPGASAVLAALTSSGLPTDIFVFAGFLPSKEAARRSRIFELRELPGTLVLFEAPSRVAPTLADLASGLGGTRSAALARELTKLHEETIRGTLDELARGLAGKEARGEFVILVAPAEAQEVDDEVIEDRLREALDGLSVRDASRAVAEELGVPRGRVYQLALALARGKP